MINSVGNNKAIVLYQDPEKQKHSEIQHLLELSLRAQFKDHNTFQKYGHGDIIVLLGTSTAGKTSIIKKLREVEKNRHEQGVDLSSMKLIQTFLQNKYPDDVLFLQRVLIPKGDFLEVHDAIGGDVFNFREGISVEDQEMAKVIAKTLDEGLMKDHPVSPDKVEAMMLDEVFSLSMEGKTSIFDILQIENVFRNTILRNFNGPIRIALIYCPFKMLADRMEERNRKARERGDLFEVRDAPFPLFQFADLFGPKQKENDLIIETLTREDVEEAFDKMVALGDNSEIDNESAKQDLLHRLGFTSPDIQQVELTPKFKKYDYLIDTSKFKPDQTVEKILHIS